MARNKDDRAQRRRRHRTLMVSAALWAVLSGCQGPAQSQPAADTAAAEPAQAAPAAAPAAAPSAAPAQADAPPPQGSRKYRDCLAAAGDDAQAQVRCLDDEVAYQSRALDQLLQERAAALSGAPRDALQAQQAAWQAETDRACGAVATGPAPAHADGGRCRLQRTIARFDVLADETPAAAPALPAQGVPDAQGALRLQLGDATIALSSDGCGGQGRVACKHVSLQIAMPALAGPQTLTLAQVLVGSPSASGATAYRGPLASGFADGWHSFALSDLNADGHEDLLVWTGSDGSYGDPSYTYYLYDAGSRRLVESRALAELVRGQSLSRIADGRLYVWSRSGPCQRSEQTIDARARTPKVVERKDYSTCTKDAQ
ncbi:lysozyme inhibitor LprI family protein [Lysobacter sp. CCNWLW3]|uniref:XAC2610-related protein n=1 Tax=unclassified Lysobacter TaxID=2635362 RepID=UPI002FD0F44E